jgi:hypothetical protein
MSDLADRLRKAKGLDLDLKQEAADEIERLNELREEDGRAMGLLIEGYNKMKTLCADGKYLADEEREAIRNVLHHIATKADYLQREDYHLRSLLERTNLDAAPTAGASDSPCAGHAGIGGTQNDAVPAADGDGSFHQEGSRVRASATPTGNTQEPVAWAVMQTDSYSVFASQMLAEKMQELCAGGEIVPLYSQPQPMLTADEWFAVWLAIGMFAEGPEHIKRHEEMADALRGLLERL